jgi:heterodisulfide reductase subunit B
MRYIYYPGCSLKSTGRPYEESLLAVFRALKMPLVELHGWNCCGATSYMSVDETSALALAARNLALAQSQDGTDDVQFVAPCNACFLLHAKVQERMGNGSPQARIVEEALFASGVVYTGRIHVRHPLDVLVRDVGLERIAAAVTHPLKGIKVACYYGCQIVRPYPVAGNSRDPMMMDELLRAAGAETLDWPLKAQCCGGSLSGTIEYAGLGLNHVILREARKRSADVIATACPLCQFNLECYQGRIERQFGDLVTQPVAYFTQLLGRAMGIPDRELGLHRMLAPLPPEPVSV